MLVELNPDCLICPKEIIEVTPVITLLRKQWQLRTVGDRRWDELNETIMILIFYILLTDTNAHHQSIPHFAHYRVNFPFFWPDELIRNFDPVNVQRIYQEQNYIRYLHGKVATSWPSGLGGIDALNEKIFATAYYQVTTRAIHVEYLMDGRDRYTTYCFAPVVDLFRTRRPEESKQVSANSSITVTANQECVLNYTVKSVLQSTC